MPKPEKENLDRLNHSGPGAELSIVRHFEKHRRSGVLAIAVATGVLCAASPAAADVTVSPPSAAQGSGENVTFKVTNTGQSAMTRVRLVIPADQPIAEVYPLSVNDWAPQLASRKLDEPLTAIHGAQPVTQAVASVTWIAMPGKALPPGKSADLSVALGPLPTAATQISFTLEPTYADPAKGAALPPAVLTLTPAAPGAETGTHHSGTGGTTGETTSDSEAAAFEALIEAESGPSFWTIAGWVVAALAAAAGLVAVLRNRRRGEPAPAAEASTDTEEKELVGAAKTSAWRYQDKPAEE